MNKDELISEAQRLQAYRDTCIEENNRNEVIAIDYEMTKLRQAYKDILILEKSEKSTPEIPKSQNIQPKNII